MKNLTLSCGRLAVIIASALSLGACSRADYATRSHATDSQLSTPIASQAAPYVPVAAEESAVVKATPPGSPAPAVASQPAPVAVPSAETAAPAKAIASAKHAPKFNLAQRLALRKITKKIDKLTAQAPQFKKQDASAARGGIDSNLRSAILFGLVGLIVLLFAGVSQVFGIVGTILLIIGLVFLVLWLLDQA